MGFKKIISSLLALTVLMTAIPVSSGATVFAQTNNTAYSGVDISRWNGEVDWAKLKSRGVDFVILRCYSYGKDKNFDKNYAGAVAAGLDVGAYSFMYATSKSEAIKEANAAVAALDGKELDYPLFLDIEYEKLPSLGKKTLTDYAIRELEIFKKAGYETGIYASKSFMSSYLDMTRLSNQYIWTAKWSLYTTNESKKKYYFKNMDPYDSSRPDGDLWQFTDGGYGAYYGTEGKYLDLDYCYVDFKNKADNSMSKNPEDYKLPTETLLYNPTSMMKGEEVSWVQAVLYQLGFIASVDGVYNPMTKAAVLRFQQSCGIAESGAVDSQTLEKLKDAYENKGVSYKIKYNPNNGSASSTYKTLSYAAAMSVGEGTAFENAGLYLGGWTAYRASDKAFLCTDGIWRSEKEIGEGSFIKQIFSNGQRICLDRSFMGEGQIISDTVTFTAQWDTQQTASNTVYYNGYIYKIYYGDLSYEQAESYCIQRGGELAFFENKDELSALKESVGADKLFVGAKASENGYIWNSGDKVGFSVSENENGENNYLTVCDRSFADPYTLFAVSNESEAAGFIMKSRCMHTEQKIENAEETSCTVNGYSGDTICACCGQVLSKGTAIQSSGHSYGAYTVTKKATCTSTGKKEKVCSVCGNVYKATIEKTAHKMTTVVTKKATTEKSGKAYDKCSVCSLKTKEYTVKRINSVKLSLSSAVYTGSAVKPTVTVKDSSGKELKKNTDYTVSYKNNKNVGTATVTVTFKGKYQGSVTRTFKIIPTSISIKSLSSKNKSATVKWEKKSKASGYVLQYSTASDFSKNVTTIKIKDINTLKKTITGLKKGKRVYFRVRCFKTVNKTNYYSKWSKVKSIKIK